MIKSLINGYKLIRILRERGNQRLFERSCRQVMDLIFCRNAIKPRNPICALFYWFGVLKGLDLVVWRLETSGFLHPPGSTEDDRARLNRYLTS